MSDKARAKMLGVERERERAKYYGPCVCMPYVVTSIINRLYFALRTDTVKRT